MIENQQQGRVFGLDLMRTGAILLVLFGHCVFIFPDANTLLHQMMLLSGFMGVEVFFILSGFLIGKILYTLFLQGEFTIGKVLYFLKRRWFRTLPNYFLILLLNIGVASIIGYSTPDLWKYLFFFQNITSTMMPFFPESWSLSVEEYAYIVLPFCLYFMARITKPKNRPYFFLFTVLFLILLFFCNKIAYQLTTSNITVTQWNVSLKSVVLYRLDSIFIGVLCSWVYSNFRHFWQNNKHIFSVIGACIFIFQFVAIGYFRLFIELHPWLWNVFYLPLVSIGVSCFLPLLSDWNDETSRIQKPVVFISLISYSLYLVHYGIVQQLLKFYVKYNPENPFELYGFISIYLLVTFSLSYLLYRFYERPLMDLRDKNS